MYGICIDTLDVDISKRSINDITHIKAKKCTVLINLL